MKLKNYKLYEKVLKFGIIGVLNTIVSYITYFILIRYNIHYSLASLFSQVVGVINSYLWNRNWTFKHAERDPNQIVRFLSVYTITYLTNLALLAIMIDSMHMNKELSGLISLFIVTMISFIGHNYWSFREKTSKL